MFKWLVVAVGGALGALARHWLTGWLNRFSDRLPYGTLMVNVAGSLLIGLILAYSLFSHEVDPRVRIFLTTGFPGAFTTFSTFSYETLRPSSAYISRRGAETQRNHQEKQRPFHKRRATGNEQRFARTGRPLSLEKRRLSPRTTSPIITGTSTKGPMTAANACPEPMPKTATEKAIASSKKLVLAA